MRWTSTSPASTASSSVLATRSARAACSAACGRSRCCSICATIWMTFAPDALLLNYVNPMAINCWAVTDGSGRPHVGLCHSVQGTCEMLARWIGVPYDEVSFLCAGINHQAVFPANSAAAGRICIPSSARRLSATEVTNEEPVRVDMMKTFRLLRHRIQRPRQRIRPLLSARPPAWSRMNSHRASRTRRTSGLTSLARAATCGTATTVETKADQEDSAN